ncbi:MAG TPA: hypothetical protein VND68_00990, partial [Chloroflexia bacterium]|nr:hypothetical protein [Chloroflexia bacterium]
MTSTNPPSDASSLLVPVYLDAWVVDANNQELLGWYEANYDNLMNFESPMPAPFESSQNNRPPTGVYLHWALPDALTHGRGQPGGGQIEFPLVPNRWLVARFYTPATGPWQCTRWVVQSDFLTTSVGTTSVTLTGNGVTSISLATGADFPVPAGTQLEVLEPDGSDSANVTTASAVAVGDTQITIQAQDFLDELDAGSSVLLGGTSAFLDPSQPNTVQVTPCSSTQFNYQSTGLGRSYTIDAWDSIPQTDGQLFLQAVGPGSVSFAAYMPPVQDVFSFVDTSIDTDNLANGSYTYMVVGWYSDPGTADPLSGVNTYDPNVWPTESDWQSQSPTERFNTLLAYLNWSVSGDPGLTPPATSLYHGMVVDVQWPFDTGGNAGIDQSNVVVAVGNTAVDALAALINEQAQQEANENPNGSAWVAAGNALADLVVAAIYDLLDDYTVPGGAALIRQQVEQSWFGSNQGGTAWTVVAAVPQSSGQSASPPVLTSDQQAELNSQLAALNQAQRNLDADIRHLASLQASFYMLWLKIGYAEAAIPPPLQQWQQIKTLMEQTIYPQLFGQVMSQLNVVTQDQSEVPPTTDSDAATQWANTNWTFTQAGGGTVTLEELGLALKAIAMPNFWHPKDPVVLISGAQRSQKHGQDGRYNADGTMTCRLPGNTITGLSISGQSIDVATLSASIDLDPCEQYTSVPSVSTLVQEAFLADPANAALMANAVSGSTDQISTGITDLLQQDQSS